MSDQAAAIVATFREDMRRARQALEALAAAGDTLKALLATNALAPGNAEDQRGRTWPGRPSSMLAAALVKYLEAGGRLEPDLAQDLANALTSSRSRRGVDPG